MNTSKELREIKTNLEDVVSRHERFAHAYFFHPNRSASGRRYAERKNNFHYSNPRFAVSVKNVYSESCANVYYHGAFYLDGKKVTVAALKKLIDALGYLV